MAELTPKAINELPLAAALNDEDLFPISSGGVTKRVKASAIKELGALTYIEETILVSFDAGTIGTRGFQKKLATQIPNGKKLIGFAVTYIANSSDFSLMLFAAGSDLYVNAYRATASAVTNNEVHVRFTFAND